MKKILLFSAFLISALGFSQVTTLTTDTTWSGDYSLDGKVVVAEGVTLTIEPGTVIKAVAKSDPVDASALIVAKGGKIMAAGTAQLPIIFTMAADPLTAADVAAGTYFHAAGGTALLNQGGQWGGLIILGTNQIGAGANNTDAIEGIAAGQAFADYGGTDTDDNSGVLKYISIRHGGATIANGDEINGLTLGGVGNGTIIENIEIISNTDDGIEFFGGNVNVNNLLVYNQSDDAIDIDQAYSGTITNSYVVLGQKGDNVFEIDGTESTSSPVVTGSYTIDGVTAVGNANAEQEDVYGHWKSDATGVNKNIVFTGFNTGSNIEGIDTDTYNNGLTFSNLDFITTDNLATINDAKDAVSAAFSASEAEVLATQAQGTGANTCVFSGWTAFAANNTGLCSSTVVGNGAVTMLTADTTWSDDVVMDGKVVVADGVTLTINPGTVIKAAFKSDPVDASALIVAKGGKIMAAGTAQLPIIFTMAGDPLTAANVASGTYFYAAGGASLLNTGGQWGGLIILGTNQIGAGANNTDAIEGIAAGQAFADYGGTDTDDNSGVLKYISIRHGGATIANGDEINGLTLGGVGNGTIIENIEIISNTDDGIEFFGGNVNVNNLLVYNQSDDAIDIDQAYSGTITNSYVVLGQKGDNVFEIDGTESTSSPVVTGSYTIDGVTAVGNANAEQEDVYGHWKSDATGVNKNIVFTGFNTGSNIEGIDTDTYNNGLTFSNLDFITTDNLATINDAKDAVSAAFSASEAEVLATQAQGTGANTCVFSGWTAFAANNTGLCSSTVVGNGAVTTLTSNTSWSGDVVMDGKVVVADGVTLTINPGTVIKAAFKSDPVDASALIVAKGGILMADGSESLPIIFTMAGDPLTAADVASGTYFHSAGGTSLLNTGGQWGGIIVLGTNQIGAGANNTDAIEGIAAGQDFANYGGTDTDDNSGVLNYVSIRHGGATIANGDEINGLTLGGVGNGTTITNIEIISNTDDGIEFFGGNVDVDRILIYNQSDDAIDIDQAYSGTITNAYVALGEKGDNVFEIDGTESTSSPVVTGSYTIDGVTAVGNANAEQEDVYGHWKSDATGANNNIVFRGFKAGSNIEGIDTDTYNNGLTFSNLDFVTTDDLATINDAKDAVSAAFSATEAEILSAQAEGTGALESDFYTWTAYFVSGEGTQSTLSVEENSTTDFSIYPNPVNNILNVSANAKVESLRLYNITGKLIKSNTNSNSINVSELSKGMYILEVISDARKEVKRVIKN